MEYLMLVANVDGRAAVGEAGHLLDLENASGGQFSSDPMAVFERWDEVVAWYGTTDPDGAPAIGTFLAPVPAPRQIFGIGLNYAAHAVESGLATGQNPMVFIKLPTSIGHPDDIVPVNCETMDWEAELVVVIGRACENVPAADAWDYVAGVTAGQDLSDRELQFRAPTPPQFNLGKSRPGYGPIGPYVVTTDALANRDDLAVTCELNGERVQEGRTNQLIFSVSSLVSYLSGVVRLLPGDLIFTGTPSGVGMSRTPPVYLKPGDVLTTTIEGVGVLTTRLGPNKHEGAN
jgi:2,4-diketo-3-deoxy-L-fuconate hydrolase